MSKTSFPVVRGNMMRITRLDGCGKPVDGPGNMITTEGFVSVALSAQTTDAEEITVTNAGGKVCVRDTGDPTFDGYGVDITFCEVEPCLFQLLTGQEPLVNAAGDVVGFTMNSKRYAKTGFALEVWTGSPTTDACDSSASAGAQPAGYFVLPFVKGGVLGDFTIENAAITFGVSGATTRDGNAWGVGPYSGAFAADPSQNPADAGPYLDNPLDKNDHLGLAFTTKGFPQSSDGCAPLDIKTLPAPSGAGVPTVSASAGIATPATVTIVRAAAGAQPSPTAPFPASGPVTVHWGDGETSTIPGSTLTGTHTYKAAGTYHITVVSQNFQDTTLTYVATP